VRDIKLAADVSGVRCWSGVPIRSYILSKVCSQDSGVCYKSAATAARTAVDGVPTGSWKPAGQRCSRACGRIKRSCGPINQRWPVLLRSSAPPRCSLPSSSWCSYSASSCKWNFDICPDLVGFVHADKTTEGTRGCGGFQPQQLRFPAGFHRKESPYF